MVCDRKSKNNYNKKKKSRYFNCNIYRYMGKDYRKLKKLENTITK